MTVARRSQPPDRGASARRDLAAFPTDYAVTRRFTVGVPRNLSVIEDGKRILFLRSRSQDEPTLCLWTLDVESGTETLLADPDRLNPVDADLPPAERARRERARESGSGIVSYTLDQAREQVCFVLGGTLFVLNLDHGRLIKPSMEAGVAAFDPRFSPDGTRLAYVAGNDLRVVELESGVDRAVAISGDPAVSYGRADFIAAEEMGRSRGFWWCPEGRRLLVTRVDENPVPVWWVSDPAHPAREPRPLRYPAAGSTNAMVGLLLVDIDDGEQTTVPWDDASSYEYLANLVCSPDRPPLLVRQTRDQLEVSIAEIQLDGDTPTLTHRHRINDDTWVELFPTSPTESPAGLLTIEDVADAPSSALGSPGPGRRALVLDGTPITGPELYLRSIDGVIGDLALVTASPVPSEYHLYLVPLGGENSMRGVRTPIRLTTDPGVHQVVDFRPADDGETAWVMVSSARPDVDHTAFALHHLDPSEPDRGLGPARAQVADTSRVPDLVAYPLFQALGADRLESTVFFPSYLSDRDGTEPLPVLLDPYGGPHAQRALKTYRPHLVSQWFADHGFVVIVTDGRGTPGRNPRWERQIWGDPAEPVLEDQIAALDAAASEFEILDLSRVAIRGWSFGGYLSALAVLRRPDRFHAAIAGAPVTDWRLYDTHYTERYLGHPEEHPIHYQRTDLLADAPNLKRPLLLIHGLADDNVVAAHTLQLSTALLAAGRPHRVLPLSGVTHMTPQETVAENLLRVQLAFLQEMLYDEPMMASSEEPDAPLVTSEPSGQLTGSWPHNGPDRLGR